MPTPFERLIADPRAARRYLVELEPWNPAEGATTRLHFSDHGFVTEPDDDPPDTVYLPRLDRGFSFRIGRELFGQGRIGGQSLPNWGEIALANADGALDPLLALGWDGRRAIVRLGGDGFRHADFRIVFTGAVEGVRADDLVLRLVIRDPAWRFDQPVQSALFAGTGGGEGGADLAGRPKPMALGRVRNVEAAYLGVVAGKHSYRVHDGPIEDVDAGWSNAVALARVAGPPSSGQYSVDAATGIVTLGGSPLDSTITWDVKGDKAGGAWRTSAAALARHVAVARAGLADPDEIDGASFTALIGAAPAGVGWWIDDDMTVAELLDRLLGAIGGWWGFTRDGRFQVGRVEAPSATATARYTEREILALERLDVALPPWRISLGHARCWRLQSGREIAGGATPERQSFVQQPVRYGTPASSAAILAAHPLARDERTDTALDEGADADAEQTRLLALHGTDRQAFRVTVKTQPFARELGETVEIVHPRFGLAAGRRLVILGMVEDTATSEVVLTLWG
jgi:hypothetical protein